MQLFHISFVRIIMTVDPVDTWTLFAFGGFLLLLLFILARGKPRGAPMIVESRTTQQWTDEPEFAEARRKAVAAVYAYHFHADHKDTPS